MKVLVTGGSGFLGRGVVAGLAAAGHEVTSGDLRVPEGSGSVEHVRLDVTDPGAVSAAVAGHEAVVHLASVVDPDGMGRDAAYRVDALATRDRRVSTVRRLVVSPGAAYGAHADNPSRSPRTSRSGAPPRCLQPPQGAGRVLLADARREHPEPRGPRIGTILGDTVDNQITALFHQRLAIRGLIRRSCSSGKPTSSRSSRAVGGGPGGGLAGTSPAGIHVAGTGR